MASKRARDTTSPSTSSKQSKKGLSPREILSPEPSATVNALVTSLSPAKPKERLFFGELSDGEAVIPLVGFDPSQWHKLEQFQGSKKPVSLINCQVSTNKITGKPQVIVKSYTDIREAQDTTFHVSDPNTLASPILPINEIDTLQEYDRVTIRVTVVRISDPQLLSNGKQKQDVVVADDTAAITLTLWEKDIGIITANKSYQLNRVQVNKYLGKYELSYPRYGASFHEIEDLEEVYQDVETTTLNNATRATVVGVGQLEQSLSCINCKKSSIIAQGQSIVECSNCETKQKARNPKTTAKLYVEDGGGTLYTLRAYQDVLAEITQANGQITSTLLLQSEPFDFSYNNFNLITAISRS